MPTDPDPTDPPEQTTPKEALEKAIEKTLSADYSYASNGISINISKNPDGTYKYVYFVTSDDLSTVQLLYQDNVLYNFQNKSGMKMSDKAFRLQYGESLDLAIMLENYYKYPITEIENGYRIVFEQSEYFYNLDLTIDDNGYITHVFYDIPNVGEEPFIILRTAEKPQTDLSGYEIAPSYNVTFNCGCDLHKTGFTIDCRSGYEIMDFANKCEKAGMESSVYSDSSYVNNIKYDDPITDGKIIYYKWEKESVNVYFSAKLHGDDDYNVLTKKVEKGLAVEKPISIYSLEEWDLFAEGWYLDKDFTQRYDFGTKIHSNITLYAKTTTDTRKRYTTQLNIINGGNVSEVDRFQTRQDSNYGVYENMLNNLRETDISSGKVLDSWCTDIALTKVLDLNSKVSGDLQLYARLKDDTRPICKVTVECGTVGHNHTYAKRTGGQFFKNEFNRGEKVRNFKLYKTFDFNDNSIYYDGEKLIGDLTLYAKELKVVNVTLICGEVGHENGHTAKYLEEEYFYYNNFTWQCKKSGYEIEGVYMDAQLTIPADTFVPGNDFTVYAKWRDDGSKKYNVTFLCAIEGHEFHLILIQEGMNFYKGEFSEYCNRYNDRFDPILPFFDSEFTKPFESITVAENITIYGKCPPPRKQLEIKFVCAIEGHDFHLVPVGDGLSVPENIIDIKIYFCMRNRRA